MMREDELANEAWDLILNLSHLKADNLEELSSLILQARRLYNRRIEATLTR